MVCSPAKRTTNDRTSQKSVPDSVRWRLLFVLVPLAAAVAAASPPGQSTQTQQSDQHVIIEAGPSEIDLRNNIVHYRDVRITQGTVRLEADEGSAKGSVRGGDNTENSEWLFSRNVHIKVEGGSLEADEARVTIVNSRMQHAVITGSPATFEKRLENGDVVHGRAGTIEYDVPNRIVHLRDNAYLTDGSKEISHQNLTYSIAEEKVIANPTEQNEERVRITINPKTVQKPPSQ